MIYRYGLAIVFGFFCRKSKNKNLIEVLKTYMNKRIICLRKLDLKWIKQKLLTL